MKLISFRKVTQGTALALFLAAFYAAVLLLGWPPLHIDQDGGALRQRKLVFLKSAPGFHETPSRAPTKLQQQNGLDNANNGSALVERTSGGGERTRLEDVFLSVKTTRTFHRSRLDAILKTWFVLAREQTYFFSDFSDPLYQIKTNGHLVNTNCSATHNRYFVYLSLLGQQPRFAKTSYLDFLFPKTSDVGNVGKESQRDKEIKDTRQRRVFFKSRVSPLDKDARPPPSTSVSPFEIQTTPLRPPSTTRMVPSWNASSTGVFTILYTPSHVSKVVPKGGKFISIGEHIRLPDDVTMGYIVEHLLKKKLTVVENFHSHLEPMKFLKKEVLSDQVTFSYSRFGKEMNILSIDGFPYRVDPTRFLSLHCHLFPNFSFCPR
ncbi:unnamed protein product [Ixodes hexagonus]